MTIGELERLFSSKKRTEQAQMKEKAYFDYTLAELIGRSIARVYNKSNEFPPIEEAYPSLFDTKEIEEKRQERQDELSALRFKQFAQAFNKKFREGGANE
nr:MAG TPA: hypothetical protein [Caudoviricetes sp.]